MANKGVISRSVAVGSLALTLWAVSSLLFAADEFAGSIAASPYRGEGLSFVTLQALDPLRGIAVFSDANSKNHLLKKDAFFPGSNVRLLEVYPGIAELVLEPEEGGSLSFFAQPGDNLGERLAKTREALSPAVLQPSITRTPLSEDADNGIGAFSAQR